MSGALAGERAVVVGLGASGHAAATALAREGAEVWVTEARPNEALPVEALPPEGRHSPLRVLAGGHRPEHLDGATLVVVSPGVAEHAPVLRWARERGLPVWSELELGARLCRVPYVAITGTNGKTTTTELVATMMRRSGLRAKACGNVGYPFSSAALEEDLDAVSVEASSFQLRFTESLRPRVSVLLNLAPDHLDWHGSFPAYAGAKARIYARQGHGDVHIGNADDPQARAVSERAPCEVRWFSGRRPLPGEVGVVDGGVVAQLDGPIELGHPSRAPRTLLADAAAAAAAGLAFGLPAPALAEAIGAAEPGEHRGQVVATLGSVRFLDHSKATNPHAALAALDGLHGVVLIAGGLAKGVDLWPLRQAAPALAAVVAIGQAAPALAEVFAGATKVRTAESMEEAVEAAMEEVSPGGTVLLAPACASQDMFRDYVERGDRFAEAARGLVKERGGAVRSTAGSGDRDAQG